MSVNELDTAYSEQLNETCVSMTHPSGLLIRIVPKTTATTAAVLAVRYGALDTCFKVGEKWKKTPQGVAHFLEHRLFSQEMDAYFAAIGAEVNAYTSHDRTAYTVSCTDGFADALDKLLRMVLYPSFDRGAVRRERAIIAEEIRMNRDNPWERCYTGLLQAMYIRHGLREEICGSEASLAAITPGVLSTCHKAFYRPSNMVLCISGPVLAEDVYRTVDEVLKSFDATSAPERRYPEEPVAIGERCVTNYMPHIDEKAVFCIGIKGRTERSAGRELLKKDLVMTVLSDMLFSRSTQFYNRLFEEGLIAPGYSNDTSVGCTWSLYTLTGEADEPQTVFERFLSHVDELGRIGLSRTDFERSRRVLYADFVTGFDCPEDIVQSLMNDAMDGLSVFDFLEVAREITLADVEREFCENLCPDAFSLSVIAAGNNQTAQDKVGG